MKKILTAIMVIAIASMCVFAQGAAEEVYPSKNINLTVPYNAGGTTDLTARALANAMGEKLGVTINVINTPGAGGSAGTLNVQNAKNDGYTWLANGMLSFCTMPINGYTDKTFREWDIWVATYAPNVIVVPADSPFNTIQDLIEAIRQNPGQITAGTAGIGSGGHFGAEIIKLIAGADYKHITYAGGSAAFTATLSGEVQFCPQLLAEYKDAIIGGQVKALCTLSDEDITIAEGITIPSIKNFYPEVAKYLPMGEVTGLLIPKGLSEDILTKIDEAFAYAVETQSFKDFCDVRSFSINVYDRQHSQEFMENFASKACWLMYDAGAVTISPSDFVIERL